MQARSTRSTALKSPRILALVLVPVLALSALALSLTGAPEAHAATVNKGAQMARLQQGVTYTSYDITGDKKADTLRVVVTGLSGDYYSGIEVYVNGKRVLKQSCRIGGILYAYGQSDGPELKYIRLKNGRPYLFINTWSDNDDASVLGIFQYKSGKMRQVMNGNTVFGKKLGSHRTCRIKKVSGNTITMECSLMSAMVGYLTAGYSYKYKSGTLKQTSRTAKVKVSNGKSRKALKDIQAYKSATSKAKKFVIKRGQSVKFLKVYAKGNTMRLQVKAGGKTGWIKCATSFHSSLLALNEHGNRQPPFDGLFWAG